MPQSKQPPLDFADAHAVWAEYRQRHDLSDRVGQTAGIDPLSGRVWIGESIPEVVRLRDADAVTAPLLFERIGEETYYRKGHRR